jgi:hypothetical protein
VGVVVVNGEKGLDVRPAFATHVRQRDVEWMEWSVKRLARGNQLDSLIADVERVRPESGGENYHDRRARREQGDQTHGSTPAVGELANW